MNLFPSPLAEAIPELAAGPTGPPAPLAWPRPPVRRNFSSTWVESPIY